MCRSPEDEETNDTVTFTFEITFDKFQELIVPGDPDPHMLKAVCIRGCEDPLTLRAPHTIASLEGRPSETVVEWLEKRALISTALALADAQFAHYVRDTRNNR